MGQVNGRGRSRVVVPRDCCSSSLFQTGGRRGKRMPFKTNSRRGLEEGEGKLLLPPLSNSPLRHPPGALQSSRVSLLLLTAGVLFSFSKKMTLWCDKYRPHSLKNLDFNKEQAERLRNLVDGGDFPHLLFYGPSGAGKKTRVLCLLREVFGSGLFCFVCCFLIFNHNLLPSN